MYSAAIHKSLAEGPAGVTTFLEHFQNILPHFLNAH